MDRLYICGTSVHCTVSVRIDGSSHAQDQLLIAHASRPDSVSEQDGLCLAK